MKITQKVKKILAGYESDNPGVKTNLARMLMHGRLAGTGSMVILPVDQGFEHGPARSFGMNEDSYDPHYHYKLGINSGCSAYAAPLGSLEAGADTFAGAVPLILKVNSSNSLFHGGTAPDQAITGTVEDALRLGCSAIGYTIYPGSDSSLDMFEELREMILEAKSYGIASVVWSYARGGNISKEGETAVDVISYGAHMACLLGAHVVKVKLPSDYIEQDEARKVYEKENIQIGTMKDRVAHVVKCCFNGRRMVVFSGGGAKGADGVYEDTRAIRDGGGNGSIIGRNSFQRPYDEGYKLLTDIMDIYKGKK